MITVRIIILYKKAAAAFLLVVLSFVIIFRLMASPPILPIFSQQDRLLPIYRVACDKKRLSFTFDAAWGADQTPLILNILDRYNIKTTFFLVGFWIEDYPEMAKEIVKRGHEIGNHSSTHPHMSWLSEQEIWKELEHTHKTIKDYTGFEAELFRPPFGDYNNRLIETCEKFGYKVVQWDVDSLDWKNLSASAIADRVLKKVQKGSIVLFHNNGKNTPQALISIIENLQSRGYEIVPVSQLIIKHNYYIDNNGEQKPLPVQETD